MAAEGSAGGRWRRLAVVVLSVAVLAALVGLGAAGLVPPLAASLGAAVYVVAVAIYLGRRRDLPSMSNPRWRDVMPCYLSVQNRDLQIIETNDLFQRDFGDAIGEHCYKAYKERQSPCPNCPVLKTFEDGRNYSSEEVAVTKDGQVANVVVTSTPLRDRRGEISAVVEMSTNITEIKRLQKQLAMMGMAVAGMAHRVKNILMGLEGGIFVVNTGMELTEQETIDEGWEMVQRNVDKISRVVKDLLYCSKEREPVFEEGQALGPILAEVHELFARRAERDGIRLRVEPADPPVVGTFDVQGIHSLITNLVSNAMDACRFHVPADDRQHQITVRSHHDERGDVVIEVQDNGPGIPDDVSHKVFENFFSTKGTEGTGLGLLVVQKVAEEHGGSVTFDTGVDRGTTFTVTLPADPAPARWLPAAG
jgi:PAS domain S-box-containing protein